MSKPLNPVCRAINASCKAIYELNEIVVVSIASVDRSIICQKSSTNENWRRKFRLKYKEDDEKILIIMAEPLSTNVTIEPCLEPSVYEYSLDGEKTKS